MRTAAAHGEFAPEINPSWFHPSATASWKQIQFGEANVQLTFHEGETAMIDGVSCLVVEPDIDYYKDLAAHSLLEVIPNALTGGLAFDRSVRLEEAKNRFTVGATSHMANVAFDKHVQFCEEYTAEVYRTLTFLFKRGPHADVLQNANALMDVRTKWSVWLTPEIETQLEKFEGALRTIGANAWLLGELRADDDRTGAVREAYGTFAAVMGWEKWHGEAVPTRDVAAEKVVEGLRKVLGIGELTRLRSELVKRATDNLS